MAWLNASLCMLPADAALTSRILRRHCCAQHSNVVLWFIHFSR